MFTLIALGVGAAYFYSFLALFFLPFFLKPLKNREIFLYFEAAAVNTTLVLLGQLLELKAKTKTNAAIKALLKRRLLMLISLSTGMKKIFQLNMFMGKKYVKWSA